MADWRADKDRVSFTIEGKELENLRDWLSTHECADPGPYDFNIYPWNTYRFSPCGFGTSVRVSCSRCGKEQDITDCSDW